MTHALWLCTADFRPTFNHVSYCLLTSSQYFNQTVTPSLAFGLAIVQLDDVSNMVIAR